MFSDGNTVQFVVLSFRMRDLSNHEKNEGAKLTKQVEKLNNDMNNLQKDKERLEGEISQMQEKMIDLHEQVSQCGWI